MIRVEAPAGQGDMLWGEDACGFCLRQVTVTTIVYGHPVPGVVTLVDANGCRCCGGCVRDAVWTAMREVDGSHVVWVVPIKAVAA